ncbi:nicotinate (nicotinamide) nucleotide adenylyltransferase [Roseibacillus persicicus]|uniref:nicotinate (nicotinamide) nucleotide adenylyltransferase n=1 Tax=Roseibacillus persicicus TaxID=454148 RepID=UPI00280D8144|nr:nicotinate (nicotinamide) nucleotide adenylyltransferase [Roseibacillus persicicus]MDQ8191394.1 nicotinate (nicotinamide) nucleotide adenylyltransferase [Roseibacillus persicicus]
MSAEQQSEQEGPRIALFGGTFDPVHEGHIEVAARAVEALSLDRVIFLPCRQSPHKEAAAGATEAQRLEMLRLATRDLPWAEVSDWEYHQPIPSFSWRTAEAFQEQFAGAKLSWLMGWDQWVVLPTWNRFSYLAELVEFIVHAREVEGEPTAILHEGARVEFVSGNHPASSSAIRGMLVQGEPVPAGWLEAQVEQYLNRNRPYRQ